MFILFQLNRCFLASFRIYQTFSLRECLEEVIIRIDMQP